MDTKNMGCISEAELLDFLIREAKSQGSYSE